MTLDEALTGKDIPEDIRKTLALITVPYVSFDGTYQSGELVVHHDCAPDLQEIFAELCAHGFPIEKIVPVNAYDWDDNASMADNNSSAFNYRFIACTDRLSNHSFGRAIDINPKLNPYTQRDGVVVPEGATHDPSVSGTITADSIVVQLFKERGWTWGGDWIDNRDWQHFEKPGGTL